MPPTPETDDTTGRDELAVISTIARALDSLDARAQRRVLLHVCERYAFYPWHDDAVVERDWLLAEADYDTRNRFLAARLAGEVQGPDGAR